jgi:transposase-like protein
MKKKGRKMERESVNDELVLPEHFKEDAEGFKEALLKKIRAAGGAKAFYAQGDFIKSLMKSTMEALLEAEMEEHLGFEKHSAEEKSTTNRRNGKDRKTIRGDFGEVAIQTPRDREASFEPMIVKKGEKSVGNFTDKVLSLYTRGLTTREIEEHLRDMYEIDVSPQFISRAVETVHACLTEWQNRPLEALYPVVYVDGFYVSTKTGENKGAVTKKCVHIVLGISVTGQQEVLGMWLQDNEGARFWLKVFNDLKARGVKDILILCGDGLGGLPDAATAVFPQVDVQLCVVHHIRAVTRYVPYQDRKEFCRDMKPIYAAPTIEAAELALSEFDKKWGKRYPASIDSWKRNWERLTAFFKYSVEIRKIIYTTNAIESLNAQLRKNISNRKIFPTENSVLTLLYLNVKNFTLRWTKRQGWDTMMNQLSIMFSDRIATAFQEENLL